MDMLWKKVHRFEEDWRMLERGDRVLAGFSGGADSVCLMRYLLEAREKKKIFPYALHVHHGLRGEEADRDEMFCRDFCKKWDIPFLAVRRDVKGEQKRRQCSLEEAGRMVRYECFEEQARRWNCQKIAVAHHKNDVAETVLFRMIRGTGVRGLSAIRPVSGTLIRPLLCLSREEILWVLAELGQEFVEDSTNEETEYSRNYIRNCVMPKLTLMNKKAVEHMAKLAEQAGSLSEYLKPVFQKKYEELVRREKGGLQMETKSFLALHPVEQGEMAGRMLKELSGSFKDISSVHVEAMLRLAEGEKGKYIALPNGLIAEKKEQVLFVGRKKELEKQEGEKKKKDFFVKIDKRELEEKRELRIRTVGGGVVSFLLKEGENLAIEKRDCVKYFDYDRIKRTLCLRTRQSGDYFIVDKEGRHKALRRYFIDEKIPASERDSRLLLAEESHILWIFGGRISEAYKVTPHTRRLLEVRMEFG